MESLECPSRQLALDGRSTSQWSPSGQIRDDPRGSRVCGGRSLLLWLPEPWAFDCSILVGRVSKMCEQTEDRTTLKPSEAERTQTQLPTATTSESKQRHRSIAWDSCFSSVQLPAHRLPLLRSLRLRIGVKTSSRISCSAGSNISQPPEALHVNSSGSPSACDPVGSAIGRLFQPQNDTGYHRLSVETAGASMGSMGLPAELRPSKVPFSFS